jgi:hypothetical protein
MDKSRSLKAICRRQPGSLVKKAGPDFFHQGADADGCRRYNGWAWLTSGPSVAVQGSLGGKVAGKDRKSQYRRDVWRGKAAVSS